MKPWDDEQLREQIALAFRQKEMADENGRLTLEVQTANFELAASNRRLAEVLEQQRQLLLIEQVSLNVVREVLQHMPTPVIGLDDDNVVAFLNSAAQDLFLHDGLLLGSRASEAIPDLIDVVDTMADGECRRVQLKGAAWQASWHRMGEGSQSRGRMITLLQDKTLS
jgi:PAS domain-containing protein